MKLKKFSKKELRWDFYPMFLGLMEKGLEVEAFLLMLSIWNFAYFRYVARSFNLDRFKNAIDSLKLEFKKFQKLDFRTIDFDKHEKEIKKIFETLSDIKEIKKTGASKMIHLKVPRVFVMWDNHIMKHYKYHKGDADDYFNFLKEMQRRFKNIKPLPGRTVPKLIDEHNYKTITEPVLAKNRKKKVNGRLKN